MDNSKTLTLLEKQRDALFNKLKRTSISELYKKEYSDIKSGRVYIFDNEERKMLRDLKILSKGTSLDFAYKFKLTEYSNLDNEELIKYFKAELERIIDEIRSSGKLDDIQSIFIEYDFYYHFISCLTCYGKQDYPLIEEPRYITSEYDYNKLILFIDKGISFEPAWINCEEFDNLDYLEIGSELQDLFKLHSRVLLHRALNRINMETLYLFKNRPFMFYINEHDCEVMMLYRLN